MARKRRVEPIVYYDLIATDLAVGAPEIGAPALTQTHRLTAANLVHCTRERPPRKPQTAYKRDRIKEAIARIYPAGAGGVPTEHVRGRVSSELGFDVSRDTVRRALGRDPRHK
jgi:hypothetical protein